MASRPNNPLAPRAIEIRGLEEVSRKLQQLGDKLQADAAVQAVNAGGNIVLSAAKAKAPVHGTAYAKPRKGKHRRPGTLRNSIILEVRPEYKKLVAYVRVKDPTGHLLEYGHKTKLGQKLERNIFSHMRKQRTKAGGKEWVEPRPYMRPAVDENAERVVDVVTQEISRFLDG